MTIQLTPMQYVLMNRKSFQDGTIDAHEYGRRLRYVAPALDYVDFLELEREDKR